MCPCSRRYSGRGPPRLHSDRDLPISGIAVISAARILLIDDHPDSRKIYRMILEKRGFSVVTAATGGEAIRKLRLDPPDVVVLDLFLPGEVQGWDVLHELRGHPSTVDIPCLVVTADARQTTRKRAMELGCTTFLSKPLDPSALVRELRRTVGGSSSQEERASVWNPANA